MRWSEIIEEFTFAVIHAKVVVEDCISQEPRHLPELTREDCLLERDYESDPEPSHDLEKLAKAEAKLVQREETLWQMEEELRRSRRISKPTKRMEQYRLQQKLFQEGSDEDEDDQLGEDDDDESWEPENHKTTAKEIAPPEKEESADVGEFRILKDNQLWENQEDIREGNKDKDNGEEIQVDGTLEKGLGPTDTLVWTGNPN